MNKLPRAIVAGILLTLIPLLVPSPAQAAKSPPPSPYRNYLRQDSHASQTGQCALGVSYRSGSWLCKTTALPPDFKSRVAASLPHRTSGTSKLGSTLTPMTTTSYPIYVYGNGVWGQYANWDADYTVEGFAFGVGSEVVGYGSWYVHDPISGYSVGTRQFQIMFSTDTQNIFFESDRLSVDSNQYGVAIPGAYNQDIVAFGAANTTLRDDVSPNYDNTASNLYVAHEIGWEVAGYPGHWDTWMRTFLMHDSSGKYLYDSGGALPPNPEGGNYGLS